jgi:hypothetical protein
MGSLDGFIFRAVLQVYGDNVHISGVDEHCFPQNKSRITKCYFKILLSSITVQYNSTVNIFITDCETTKLSSS